MLEKRAKDYAETRAKYLFAGYKSQPQDDTRYKIVHLLESNAYFVDACNPTIL